jgi:hypothetical protein
MSQMGPGQTTQHVDYSTAVDFCIWQPVLRLFNPSTFPTVVLRCPFRQIGWRQLVIELVAGDPPGPPNPSIRHHRPPLIRQQHIGGRLRLGRQGHRHELALQAVADALQRAIPYGQKTGPQSQFSVRVPEFPVP